MDSLKIQQHEGLKYFENERREMLKYIPQHAKTALDVGCGGGFGKILIQEHSVEVLFFNGIEDMRYLQFAVTASLDKINLS